VDLIAGKSEKRNKEHGMAQQSAGITRLKQALEDLGSASEGARLQLHLLALEARQRTGDLEANIENMEHRLDRGIHQAISTATDKARQLTKTLQESLRGHPPTVGPRADRLGTLVTEPVYTCSPDDSLARAAQIMWEHDCGAVPVIDAERRPCGMITDRDVCMGAYTRGQPLHAVRVSEVMSRHVRSCSVDDSLQRAIGTMVEARVRRVPIVGADGRLAGILSLGDAIRAATLLGQRDAEELVFQLVGAVSQRRPTDRPLAAE
jgi:CBS domain-containing protein